jgi:maleate isomerase
VSRGEYARRGLIGILTPQANTAVEAELGVLLEPGFGSLVSRLTCHSDDSRERLVGYFRNIDGALRAFDTAQPDLVLFACTGSTYLVGLEEEKRRFASLSVPVVSAAAALIAALDELGATRIALVSPYPPWLTEACVAFWKAQGKSITAVTLVEGERNDTRGIYSLGTADALRALGRLDPGAAQAILLTGTGMPSLNLIARQDRGLPVLSSNLCLGWRAAGVPLRDWLAPGAAWRARLALRFP